MYRAFVTYPDGSEGFLAANVVTAEDRQAALNRAGQIVQQAMGLTDEQAAKMSPQQKREVSAKVEFFKVAMG